MNFVKVFFLVVLVFMTLGFITNTITSEALSLTDDYEEHVSEIRKPLRPYGSYPLRGAVTYPPYAAGKGTSYPLRGAATYPPPYAAAKGKSPIDSKKQKPKTSPIDAKKQKPKTNRPTCDKFPRICRGKGSPGPDCCKKKCVNVMFDGLNCGMCGNKCRYGQICCRGNCVNPLWDKRNCGGCNNRCKKGDTCVYGMCNYGY